MDILMAVLVAVVALAVALMLCCILCIYITSRELANAIKEFRMESDGEDGSGGD